MSPFTRTMTFDRGSLLRNLALVCISLELLFFALDYQINYAHGSRISEIRSLFSTAREDSLPAWFSIMQTALVALTLWVIYVVVRQAGSRWQAAGWLVLALFFSYLALDDGAHIHENIGTAYHNYFSGATSSLGAWTLEVFPSYRWQIVFMPIFAAMGCFMFLFLLRELRGNVAKAAVFLALACLAAAVVLDFFEGLDDTHPLNVYTAISSRWQLDYFTARTFGHSAYVTLTHFSKSIEETLEMFAMTLLWVVFADHLTWIARDMRVRFVDATCEHEATTPAERHPSGIADLAC